MKRSPIDIYCDEMREIKDRISAIDLVVNKSPHVPLAVRIESAGLQIRKVLERIAFASLCANKEIYTHQFGKASKAWNANTMIKDLGKVNPKFYPEPVIDSEPNLEGLEIPPGVDPSTIRGWEPFKGKYLTKNDLESAYGLCGSLLHADNPFGKRIKYEEYIPRFNDWLERIRNLLNKHVVHFVHDSEVWMVHMVEEGVDDVRAYVMTLQSKDGKVRIVTSG